MPTYDYECDSCGETWEFFQKITDDAITKCPACGKKKARRLFGTGAAIMFKGSGFYQTDYRSDSYRKGEKSAKDATESKSESAANAGSDTKSGAEGGTPSNSGSESKTDSRKKESKPAKPAKPPSESTRRKKKRD